MQVYRLLKNESLQDVKAGNIVTDVADNSYIVIGWTPPRQPHSHGMVHVATLRTGTPTDLLPEVVGCHIATQQKARETFVLTLSNAEKPLETMTITVEHEHQLLKALHEFLDTIEFLRSGDVIAITTL